jgi:hypothetical protein
VRYFWNNRTYSHDWKVKTIRDTVSDWHYCVRLPSRSITWKGKDISFVHSLGLSLEFPGCFVSDWYSVYLPHMAWAYLIQNAHCIRETAWLVEKLSFLFRPTIYEWPGIWWMWCIMAFYDHERSQIAESVSHEELELSFRES